eukprot:g17619.t1
MNPLHRGHAQLIHQAVDRLHKEGYDVVGAWLSPSHDGYVQPKALKMGTIGLSALFRLEAARRAVLEDELLSIGSWEAKKPGRWPDYPEVAMALQRKLRKVEKAWNLTQGFKVFYACGTDHATNQGLYRGFLTDRGFGVVIVPRLGEEAKKEQPERSFWQQHCHSNQLAFLWMNQCAMFLFYPGMSSWLNALMAKVRATTPQ